MTWQNDEELENESKFVKFEEGMNTVIFRDDGIKCRAFGKPAVEFKVEFNGKTDMILSVRPSPLLDVIRDGIKEHETLVGHALELKREGTTKENTRYSDMVISA